ncbi:probable E3 ubiquitin ligase SUD1 [Rutidosis leptorrhynchoides]|uniref:probable E3 ubiquitin ligase SUD1 n=1 Tax=Rutidosis leptorrhynchoides TaxID=125765 RepID=UPI003A99D794
MVKQLVLALLDGVINADFNASGSSSSSVLSASSLTSDSGANSYANSSKNIVSNSNDDDDDEDGDVCRICRNSGDVDNPLRYPCVCSGSIKFVHQDCLLRWLNHSNAPKCEICEHPFLISPVYAENAPANLTYNDFVIGISTKIYHVLQFIPRLTFVLFMWLVHIPFYTFWVCRFSFVTSFGECMKLYRSHHGALLTDCLHGFLLSAIIMCIYVSLMDYFIDLLGDDGGWWRVDFKIFRCCRSY